MVSKLEDYDRKEIKGIITETPYIIGSFVFLTGDTDLIQEIAFAPAGILRNIKIYTHSTEAAMNTVYLRIEANNALILPAVWENTARAYIPAPTINDSYDIDMNYPCPSETHLRVELNQAPAAGLVVIATYEPYKMDRKRMKRMIKSYEEDLK